MAILTSFTQCNGKSNKKVLSAKGVSAIYHNVTTWERSNVVRYLHKHVNRWEQLIRYAMMRPTQLISMGTLACNLRNNNALKSFTLLIEFITATYIYKT